MLTRNYLGLGLLPLVLAAPSKRWYPESVGANYFATNGFGGNQLVASYILPDGNLVAGTAPCTGGNGSAGINGAGPFENHADPFYTSGSVIVTNDTVVVVNAGSDTFSVFDIPPQDPARPTFRALYPSVGEFPVSLAASPDGSIVCVLSGGASNGFACYSTASEPWTHVTSWDRSLGLNLTTPIKGPIGGTVSQITFASDSSALLVAVKGMLPTDLNNPKNGTLQPGAIYRWGIGANWTLDAEPTKTPAALPFSLNEDLDTPNVYFASDAATGYAVFKIEDGQNGTSSAGLVPNHGAVCWAVQSPKSKSFYGVDIAGRSNITEVSVDTKTLNGTILSAHSLGVNASGTDVSIFAGEKYDWMYVNAPAYHSIHTYRISGPGNFSLVQRYRLSDMPQEVAKSEGFSGQAVYYKP